MVLAGEAFLCRRGQIHKGTWLNDELRLTPLTSECPNLLLFVVQAASKINGLLELSWYLKQKTNDTLALWLALCMGLLRTKGKNHATKCFV